MVRGVGTSISLGFLAVALFLIEACAFAQETNVHQDASAAITVARAQAIAREQAYVAEVLREMKGYQAWSDSLRAFYDDLRQQPGDVVVDSGNGTLVLTQVVDYQLRGDRRLVPGKQFEGEETEVVRLVSGLSNQLRARGIDLIVVPVPTKLDIYPQHLSESTKAGAQVSLPLIHLVDGLLAADVEVVNLLRSFRRAHANDRKTPLYYRTDHHWTAAGMQLAAREIKTRLARYAFEAQPVGSYSIKTLNDAKFVGKFVGKISEDRQHLYPPEAIKHVNVFDRTGNPYDDVDASPVLVMGDSFVLNGFQEPSYGFTASLAFELSMPVSRIVSVGSNVAQGPRMLARKGHDFIESKRVVLWVLSVSSFKRGSWNWAADAEIILP